MNDTGPDERRREGRGTKSLRRAAAAVLRVAGEVIGIGCIGAIAYGGLLMSLAISYGVLYFAAGVIVAFLVWIWIFSHANRRWGMSVRRTFDLMLVALAPATLLTYYSIAACWPIAVKARWGAGGGEGNLMWLVPLHLGFFALLVWGGRRLGTGVASDRSRPRTGPSRAP